MNGDNFLERMSKTQFMKKRMVKLGFAKFKNLYVKDTIKIMRREATLWEKIFAEGVSEKGLLYKVNK